MKTKIAVFVSGGGTNLQALIDAFNDKKISAGEIKLVISSNKDAYALKRAQKYNIDNYVVNKKEEGSQALFEKKILSYLKEYEIDMIVLAGFMNILSKDFIKEYPKRIINVHPSLIPSFCGKGMYGLRVHEAALAYGVKVSGATVHYVNEIADGGEIIFQKAIKIKEDDTAESLQLRIMNEAEWILLPKAVQLVAQKIKKEKKDVRNKKSK